MTMTVPGCVLPIDDQEAVPVLVAPLASERLSHSVCLGRLKPAPTVVVVV
jgi:hypothetical protein